MAITGRFVVLLAVGLLPVIVIDGAWVLPGWLLLVAAIGAIDLLLAGSPRSVVVTREVPRQLRLGESTTATVLVQNVGRRTIRALVRDAWQPSAGAASTRTRMTVPPGERRSSSTTLTPFRRGERRSDQVTIRSFGPLHLLARQASLDVPATLRVLPEFKARRHLPSRLARLRELDGRTSVMIRGQGSEFDSLREYVRGDDVRSIDWRATARRQEMVVRTWRPERDRRVVIIVDSGRTAAARIDDEPRLDTAFESALLLAALASHAGDRVDTLVYDRRVRGRVLGASAGEMLSRMVTAMAPIDAELIEMDWSGVPALVDSVTNRRALVVLLTTIDAPGSSRGLLAALPQLTRRHNVLVASVSDPAVLEAAGQRNDRRESYRAAAAERSLVDTARVAAAVRRLGAEVIVGAPAELPPALADRYIAMKAAGRL